MITSKTERPDLRMRPDRRKLTPDQLAVYKELREYSRKGPAGGAIVDGLRQCAVPQALLISAVELIQQLRQVEDGP